MHYGLRSIKKQKFSAFFVVNLCFSEKSCIFAHSKKCINKLKFINNVCNCRNSMASIQS